MAPMMVMTIDTTAAKIGRAMKKRLKSMGWPPSSRQPAGREDSSFRRLRLRRLRRAGLRLGDGEALGLDLGARTRALQASGDHPLAGSEALAHHPQAVDQRSRLDVAAPHHAVVLHHEN